MNRKTLKNFHLFILALLSCVSASAQNPNPASGRIFTELEVPEIHILIDPDSLDALYDPSDGNWWSNHEYPATFVWKDSWGSDTLEDIGFRFRGNTSRSKIKKSFKISINSFISGRRYQGLKKLNINAEPNDPAMLRSYALWKMYRDQGIAASRSNHVEMYINGDYYGLYQNCEHINDDWLDLRFNDDAGNLYKCTYPADLAYLGNDPNLYKLTPPWSGTRVYDIKTNREQDDYSGLADFIDFMHNAGSSEFACGFPHCFNVWHYLKVAAIDVLSGNWDGYIYNMNNFYLYDNPRTGRFEYLPYDLDNTWGLDWIGLDWSERDVYDFSHDEELRILYDRLMDTPVFRDVFSYYLREMGEHYLMDQDFADHLEAVQSMIGPSAMADTYRPIDFGFSEANFWNGLYESAGGHVKNGLVEFAETRVNNNAQQVEQNDIAPIIWELREDFSNFPEYLSIRVRTEGPDWTQLKISYRFDGGTPQGMVSYNGNSSNDFPIPIPPNSSELHYNVEVVGENGLSREAYCQDRRLRYGNMGQGVVINEVMASNATTIADEHGDFDDWIELYNAQGQAVNLTNCYLVDKDHAPKYWALPGFTMEPGDFLLVWADDEIEQGPLHTNFKVSSGGEGIYLFREHFDGMEVLDLVQVPPSPTDVSWGREIDAGLPWVYFDTPTPGASNHLLSTSLSEAPPALLPYPNPCTDLLQWKEEAYYELYDLSGRLLDQGRGKRLAMNVYSPGAYILRMDAYAFRVVKQ